MQLDSAAPSNTLTEAAGTSRLMGYLYCAIAVITLLGGGYLQASLWACGAGIWFSTAGRSVSPFSATRQWMARLFTAAFIIALACYAMMLSRNWW
jgi:hypothetical protein